MKFKFPNSMPEAMSLEAERLKQLAEVKRDLMQKKEALVRVGALDAVLEMERRIEKGELGLAEIVERREALKRNTSYTPEVRRELAKLYDQQEDITFEEISEVITALRNLWAGLPGENQS